MPDIELVVTNNLARARARMSSSSQYNDLDEQGRNEPSVEIMRDSATEDDYLLSPRRTRRG